MEKYQRSAKGQITLFIVIGIVVLIIISLLILTRHDYFADVFSFISFGKDAAKAKSAAEDCLKLDVTEGLKLIEAQGGYTQPSKVIIINDGQIGYIYFNNTALTLEDIEKDLAQYTEGLLPDCFKDGFGQYHIEQTRPNVTVNFEDSGVLVTAAWIVQFTDDEGKATFSIDEIGIQIPSYFKLLFGEAGRLVPIAPSIDLSKQYYNVENASVRTMLEENKSIAYFSKGEEYFVTAYG